MTKLHIGTHIVNVTNINKSDLSCEHHFITRVQCLFYSPFYPEFLFVNICLFFCLHTNKHLDC